MSQVWTKLCAGGDGGDACLVTSCACVTTADRVNVFVPLVEIDDKTGGTEMKKGSHVRSQGGDHDAASFAAYEHLDSVTHKVPAGTPVIMDYRVWHRGLANTSVDTVRPLLYFKYALRQPKRPAKPPVNEPKKRKRIVPVVVQPSAE